MARHPPRCAKRPPPDRCPGQDRSRLSPSPPRPQARPCRDRRSGTPPAAPRESRCGRACPRAYGLVPDRLTECRVLVALRITHHVAGVAVARLERPHVVDLDVAFHVKATRTETSQARGRRLATMGSHGAAGRVDPGSHAFAARASAPRLLRVYRAGGTREMVGSSRVHRSQHRLRSTSREQLADRDEPPDGELFHLAGEFREVDRRSAWRTHSRGSRRIPTIRRPRPLVFLEQRDRPSLSCRRLPS